MLRLYVSTEYPSDELRMLVGFVVGHYFPVWCAIKKNDTCTKGAQNLFRAVELLRDQPEVVQRVVRAVIQRNAYWAHPEQLLLAMVADEQQSVREEGVRMITAARQCEAGDEVRPFTIPALRFGAERYNDLIDWENEVVTQPPLLSPLSDKELRKIEEAPLLLPDFPVNTQAVERAVRVVTEASEKVQGEEARHGCIAARLKHRKQLPVFSSKKDFLI